MSRRPMLATAPGMDLAVSDSGLAFHRSHSTPDLLLSGGTALHQRSRQQNDQHDSLNHSPGIETTPRTIPRGPLDQRTLRLKRLPSLPAFDVPTLDFEFDFNDFGSDFRDSLRFESSTGVVGKVDALARPKTAGTHEKTVVEDRARPTPVAPAIPEKETRAPNRRKSRIDRHRSWLSGSKSSPDVRATIRTVGDDGGDSGVISKTKTKDAKGAVVMERKALVAETEVPPVPPLPAILPPIPPTKPMERSKTVESLAGLAKRSWMSRSPSPSPSKEAKTPSRQRADSNLSMKIEGTKSQAEFEAGPPPRGAEPASGDAAVDTPGSGGAQGTQTPTTPSGPESLTSTGRALNRASSYLTKFKRPQSVYARAQPSSFPLSASTSSPDPLFPRAEDEESEVIPEGNRDTAWPDSPAVSTITLVSDLPATSGNANNPPEIDHTTVVHHRNSSHTTSSDHTDSDTTAISENASTQASSADTALTMPHPTSRDPLWSTFRSLDDAHAQFATKALTSAKTAAVKATLLPFLHATATHASNAARSLLTPEDVDRRAVILNKWWNGLLEMLEAGQCGQQQQHINPNLGYSSSHVPPQPVAGVDRPALLEAATMIMTRPEWRLSTPSFQPLAERSPAEKVRASRSGSPSPREGNGDWGEETGVLVETAEHNVRTMFVATLTAQMAVAVEKMALRHAPTSLVNWSGKACAYAFFFCPGAADVLVRLWGLKPDVIRRTADALGLPRRSRGESEGLVAFFPPHLGGLGWTSAKTITEKMRTPARLPPTLGNIHWHGPWTARWRGADTDLFYVFAKYYHVLAGEFTPGDLPLVERARAPAFVLVHAQVLATLDGTIRRTGDGATPMADQAVGSDASMNMAMPPGHGNAFAGTGENRLVVLLRDMLGENPVGVLPGVRTTFARAFMAVTKAATKATGRFEHGSVHMLCDLLEEVLPVYHAFQNGVDGTDGLSTTPAEEADLVDWPFWLDVSRKILGSNHTLAEIRLLSFLHSLWDIFTADPSRRRSLTIDWLLCPATFASCFANWCPMVRAYFARLLCWRVCRASSGSPPTELDEEISCLVARRLETVWTHYLWLRRDAEQNGRVAHCTAPSPPTPQKRFMIIRTELQAPPAPGMFSGFDQPFALPQGRSHRPSSLLANVSESPYKKKSLFARVLSWTTTTPPAIPFRRNASSETDLEGLRSETARCQEKTTPRPTTADSSSSTGSAPLMDEVRYHFRFQLAWANAATLNALRTERVLSRPRLPASAWVMARAAGGHGVGGGFVDGVDLRGESPEGGMGLVREARNARPLGVAGSSTNHPQATVRAVRPTGMYAAGAPYVGRALAEWGIVVHEHDAFVERRRDEGVSDPADVEVPSLGVEGMGPASRRG